MTLYIYYPAFAIYLTSLSTCATKSLEYQWLLQEPENQPSNQFRTNEFRK